MNQTRTILPVPAGGTTTTDPLAFITNYTPRPDLVPAAVWQRIGPTVKAWVADAAPHSVHTARGFSMNVAQYATFWEDRGLPLDDPESVFTPDRVDEWVSTLPGSANSKLTRRAYVRSVGKAVTRTVHWGDVNPVTYQRGHSKTPYTPSDVNALYRLIGQQPNQRATDRLALVLDLSFGAGAHTGELLHIRARDIRTVPHPDRERDVLIVTMSGRDVPLRDAHTNHLRRLLPDRAPDDLVVVPEWSHRTSLPKDPWDKARKILRFPTGTKAAPHLDLRRARATWGVAMLTSPEVTIAEVFEFAGTDGGRALDRWLPHVPIRTEDNLAFLLGSRA